MVSKKEGGEIRPIVLREAGSPPTHNNFAKKSSFLVHELIDSCKKDYHETHIASDGMHTNDPKGPLPTLADEGKHPLLLTAKVTRVKETK